MKIAITGASGQLGRLIIEQLLSHKVAAENIVALVRNPAKAADLGVEVREADYEQPDTLEAALRGIDTLMLISGSEPPRDCRRLIFLREYDNENTKLYP